MAKGGTNGMKKGLLRNLMVGIIITAICLLGSACGGGYYAPMGGMNGVMDDALNGEMTGEGYTEIIENSFTPTDDATTSYFSVDVNTASYPNLRSLIKNRYEINKDAVRVEEMLNYFDYDYETPTDGSVFKLNSSIFDTPYSDTKLLTVGLAAKEIEFTEVQNNLVFLIDTSGSMASDDKLPLVQTAFTLLAENLNATDRVSIVTYAGSQSVALNGAYGYQKTQITAVIQDLFASGSTAGSSGIETAYRLASQYFIEGGNNRVILATDGDFNVGLTGVGELENFISEKRESGIYFSVFGVGRGNIQSEKMETLALNGNGTYSYIDSVKEARRALVEQIGGSMVTVAKDVKASVTFNADFVEEFRLIGYENKQLTEEEFNDASTDAGEVGSGHTITVVYELKLRQGALSVDGNVADVKLRYKPVGDGVGEEAELDLGVTVDDYHQSMTENDAFVSSVIEFALVLRDSAYKGSGNVASVIARLEALELTDEYKQEFLQTVKDYKTYYQNKKVPENAEESDDMSFLSVCVRVLKWLF